MQAEDWYDFVFFRNPLYSAAFCESWPCLLDVLNLTKELDRSLISFKLQASKLRHRLSGVLEYFAARSNRGESQL